MTDWQAALEKFVKEWGRKPEVVGIVVCGSYITGNPTKHSDIDIQIVLKKGCKWRERGNKIIDGFLMEYFANPPERTVKYFEEDWKIRRMITAHMFATGKIILEKNDETKKLVKIAKKYLNKNTNSMPKAKIELAKYHLFDGLDNLQEIHFKNTPDFNFVYYSLLGKIFDYYSEYAEFPNTQPHKILRFLLKEEDRKKYNIQEFQDSKFVKLFIQAITEKEKSNQLKIAEILVKYVQSKMGGFNISNWKFRSSAK